MILEKRLIFQDKVSEAISTISSQQANPRQKETFVDKEKEYAEFKIEVNKYAEKIQSSVQKIAYLLHYYLRSNFIGNWDSNEDTNFVKKNDTNHIIWEILHQLKGIDIDIFFIISEPTKYDTAKQWSTEKRKDYLDSLKYISIYTSSIVETNQYPYREKDSTELYAMEYNDFKPNKSTPTQKQALDDLIGIINKLKEKLGKETIKKHLRRLLQDNGDEENHDFLIDRILDGGMTILPILNLLKSDN